MAAKKNQFTELIDILQEVNEKDIISVWIPSLQRSVDFKPITVQQQKKIISTALESSLNTMAFNIITNNLIKECCSEPDLLIYAFDKPSILTSLRGHMLGYDIIGQSPTGNDVKVNVKDHCEKFPTHKIPKTLLNSKIIKHGDIEISFKPPLLEEDTAVNTRARKKIDELLKDKNISSSIGEVIVYELIKYIKSITISGKILEFNYTDVLQLVKVVDQLPLKLSKLIITEIEKIKKYEDKFGTLTVGKEKVTIVVDARFFNGE